MMVPSVQDDESPSDDYFNDLSQQPLGDQQDGGGQGEGANGQVPKPKRIACVLCRKRKLRCDGNKPSCGTCTRLQHDCSYDEVRRKSGPKRGYVKALEARLAQVETLLKAQDDAPVATARRQQDGRPSGSGMAPPEYANIAVGSDNINGPSHNERSRNTYDGPEQAQFPHSVLAGGDGMIPSEEPFPWEMIGLGLDEPLPTADAVNELTTGYFEKIHPSLPMIHRPRYYAAMNLAPHMRPPICLRYAMWANAATVMDKYEGLQEHFYARARKYIQQDEMKGHGESMITIAHAQTWILLAMYEFKLMYFPRAWMSAGRTCRMTQMMGLHRLDGTGLDVKQCLPPPKDPTEREERRRTFWASFCMDRYSSIGTGWPMTIEESDIMTSLPADDNAYELNRPGKSMKLEDALHPSGVSGLSSFGGVALMACLFGRNLTHLHRPGPSDQDDDLNGEFWKRHRQMDNILLSTALALPDSLRLPTGLNNPNIVFLNMNMHTSTICLHQAAIFKADKNRMPARISAENKVRCIAAAAEIASIMRQVSHLDLSSMNPFTSFCLYVAARVFVQYLKSRPKDSEVRASLQFLLSAMHAIKRKNPLTESFLVQLDVDLEGAGLEDTGSLRATATLSNVPNKSSAYPSGASSNELMMSNRLPTYGDNGIATYTKPNSNSVPAMVSMSNLEETLGYRVVDAMNDSNDFTGFPIPTRVRSPGSSVQGSGSGTHQSPDMDTSPDNSGDHRTPNSQRHATCSRTSHTGYSPQNPQHQYNGSISSSQQQNSIDGGLMQSDLFDPTTAGADFTTDFDIHTFPAGSEGAQAQQQSGFVLPSGWGGARASGTGMTPGPTGMTPAPMGMTPGADMMGMSEADWNQVLDGFQTWDPGMTFDGDGFPPATAARR